MTMIAVAVAEVTSIMMSVVKSLFNESPRPTG